MKEKSRKKFPKLKSALRRGRLSPVLDSLSPEDLAELAHELRTYLNWWMGDPTEESILALRNSLPLLDRIVAFDVVLQRLDVLDSFERTLFGVKIGAFFPELSKVYKAAASRFFEVPPGVHKAECWLKPIAHHAGADADVEAAVYFASRGQAELVDVDSLRDSWHSAVCLDIEHDKSVGKVPEAVLERARSKTVSLSEAATALTFHGEIPRFFGFRDEEEDFIDASLFRAVEWFGITGFDPWLNSLVSDLSRGPQYGVEHTRASWWLFFWCRSDLALAMADKQGLESWLWALVNGPLERDKPWRYFWADRENPRSRDYVPLAGVIPFIWHRIKPVKMRNDVLHRASDFLSQTQMRCGGWPLDSDSSEPDLIATCFAIHGLAAHRPTGWQQTLGRAADWLSTQQQPGGDWYISGGPPVMLTVLALDALDLARGRENVTFKLGADVAEFGPADVLSAPATSDVVPSDPIYECSGEPWYNPDAPTTTSIALNRAHNAAHPRLAIVVATEAELRQVLSAMSPLPRRRRVWRVTHRSETYFLGRFGAFQCVLMLSSMSSQGPTGATLSVDAVIREWDPVAALLIGVAFGASRRKHRPADVLVAEHIIPYEHQRVGKEPMFRNPVPPSSPTLVNRFRHALDWTFCRPDGSFCSRHVGPVLSGDKLIDNSEFKNSLLNQYPNAIGGEMEGSGFWAAADRARKHWILVKGVCDWADGRKRDSYQQMAAASAVSLALHVFSDAHALDGV